MIAGPRTPRALAAAAMIAAALANAHCKSVVGPESTGGSGGSPTTTTTTSESGSAGSGTTTTSTTSTTDGPIMCLTGGVTVPELTMGECDLLQQNCGPGATCLPDAAEKTTFCRKGGGLKSAGKDCVPDSLDECQAGLFCIGPKNGVGTCTRPCCPGTDEPCNGGDCVNNVVFEGTLKVLMCTYFEKCTLFDETSCEEGERCQLFYPSQNRAVCTTPAPEMKAEGDPCSSINQCGEAQVCHNNMACRYSCILGSSGLAPGKGGCLDGQTCKDVYTMGGAQGIVGVCQ